MGSSSISVRERYDYIIKSENDDSSYRGLILSNQIKVLLISDPTTKKGAAALNVDIGSTADPKNMSGLAQLLQRVLYITDQNDRQRNFKDYIKQNGGTIECETNEDYSNYYFNISVTKFKDTLKMFADFFTKPYNFKEAVMKSEIEIMCKENIPNEKNDIEVLNQLFKWIINCDHPISKRGHNFTTQQNHDTVFNNLEKFYNNYYYAHAMSLCVLSKESLNELENWVRKFFYEVKEQNATDIPCMKMQRWRAPQFTSVYKISCAPYNKDTPCTRLYVIFPTETFNYYRYTTALQHFLAYLFKYDGKGSLLSVLKTKGWGYSIEAESLPTSKCFSFFNITVDLTDEGLEHIDDIMTLFIQYVKMFKEDDGNGLRRIYNEYKEIVELKFRFDKKKPSFKDVSIISQKLQHTTNMKDILCLEYIPIVNSGRIIKSVINNFLSPLRMRICIIAEKYKNFTEELEPWYRYRYKKEMVSVKTCANWWNNPCAILNLPAYNEFIPTKFNIKLCEDNEDNEDNAEKGGPTVIWNTQFVRLWHKKDDEFNEPRANIKFHFISPFAYANSFNANLTHLFIRLINNSLSEYLYPAASVGLYWKLNATLYGIQLDIRGFDDKQYILLKKILDRMINFQLSPENFEIDRQNHVQSCAMQLKQLEDEEPLKQANYYLSMLLNNYSLSRDEILIPIKAITFKRVQQFISDLFNSIYVECLIYGNITRAEALDVAHLIENKLSHVIPLTITHLEMYHDFESGARHNIKCDESNGDFPRCVVKNKFSKRFAQFFYQINERSRTQSYVLLNLIKQIIDKPLSDLIIENELSDKVYTGVHRENKIQGLKILIESLKQDQNQVIKKIVNFMNNNMKEYINKMSEEKFQESKKLFADSYREEKPKTLYDVSTAFWAEISNQQYNFDRNDQVKYLHQITKNDLCIFFETLLDSTNNNIIFDESI